MNVPVNAADQAQQASQTGDVLKPKHQQVAGMGNVIPWGKAVPWVVELLGKLKEVPSDAGKAVPTPRTERLDLKQPSDKPFSYPGRQEEVAEQVLSPEGKLRFDEANQSARAAVGEDANILHRSQQALQQQRMGRAATDPEAKTIMPESLTEEVVEAAEQARQAIVRGEDGGIDINFEKIITSDGAKALLNAVSEVTATATHAVKRGTQTWDDTTRGAQQLLADELGVTSTFLRRKSGQLFNDQEMEAGRTILIKSAEELDGMSKEIIEMAAAGTTDAAKLLAFRRQMAIHAGFQMQYKGAQTEIARAMQSFRKPIGSDINPELVMDMLNGNGGMSEAMKLAKGFQKALTTGGRSQANKYVEGGWASKANGVFQEVYVNGLLSWVSTQYKNLFSTPTFMIGRGAEEVLAGFYGGMYRSALRAAGKEVNPEGVYMGDLAARVYGSSRSINNGWSIMADVWRTELPSDALSKLDVHQYRSIAAGSGYESRKISHWLAGKWIDRLGRVIRIPQRALLSVDEFWKTVSDGGELHVQAKHAFHNAKAAGKTDQEAMDDALMIMLDPRAVGKEMDTAARAVTLTTDLSASGELAGTMGKMVSVIQRNPFGRMIVPFITVPTNDVLEVIARSPAFWVMSKGRADILGKNGPAAMQKAMARVTLGTGTMFGVYQMALDGRITGGVPTDRKERQRLRLANPKWQPYSLVFRGDDWPVDEDGDELPLYDAKTGLPNGELNYVPYGGYGPVAGLIAIGASIAERMRTTTDPDVQSAIISNGIAATVGYFGNMPFLMGVANIYKAIDYDNPGYLLDAPVSNTIPGTPFPIPFSSAGRNVANMLDPVKRSPSQSYDLYTIEDVEAMEKKNGEFQYGLVGFPKGPWASAESLRNMMGEYWQLQTRDSVTAHAGDFRPTEDMAVEYDVLGREIEKGVRFDENPVRAIANLILPLKVIPGRKPTELEATLVSLGVPLSRKRDAITVGGRRIGLSKKQQSDWVNLAKNEVMLTKKQARYSGKKTGVEGQTFVHALETLVNSEIWFRTDTTVDDQINMIRNLEGKFYDAALEYLLGMPENSNLSQAVYDLEELHELGMSRVGVR